LDSRQRIGRTLAFEPCDRAPVIAQVFAHAALASGRSVDAYLSSAAVAAACQIEAQAHYGYDAVFAVLDLTLEAEAAGGEVQSREGLYPSVSRPPFSPDDDFTRLAIPEPATAARLPLVLEMAGRLRRAYGDETVVTGLVQGPTTLAVQFLGMERALYLAADDPDRFLELLDYTAAVARAFGLAQLAAGAHLVLVFEPAACPEVVPPGLFREMIAPRLARLFTAFKQAGAIGNWLHIAGRTAAVLPRYAGLGADIGNFDYCVDAGALLGSLGDSRLCLDGNVKPLSFVTDDPADIEREAEKLLRLFDRRGGFILSSGCEIPPESREANVAAMVRCALDWKRAPSLN
jgi:uroporphyrinogen decarboxylase